MSFKSCQNSVASGDWKYIYIHNLWIDMTALDFGAYEEMELAGLNLLSGITAAY